MPADIVDRLRAPNSLTTNPALDVGQQLRNEAADEIERLRRQLANEHAADRMPRW